jgi:adenylate kinase
MLHKYQALLLIGLPGSGKSTQGKILGSLSGLHYWEASETFRAIDADSEIGRLIHQYISRGELIPDELAVSLCLDDLKARVIAGAYHPATDMLVFDGIPRTVKQAALLDEHVTVMKILYLVCDDIGQVIQRLRQRAVEQGRADDANESIISHRLEVYQRYTAELLRYYPTECIVKIDALRSPVEVLDQILHVIISLLSGHAAQSPPT